MTHLLDSSAVIAYYFDEPGADQVALLLEDNRNPPAVSCITQIEFWSRLRFLDKRILSSNFLGMGMFDTIHFSKPVPCPGCGAEIASLQTKDFDSCMDHYYVGSILRGGSIIKGIVEEEIWCQRCFDAKAESRHPIYLVVWNSILAGVETTEVAAEQRLATVDRLDLVGWLDEAQRSSDSWRARFFRLLGDIEKWHQHLERQENPQENERSMRWSAIFKLPDEILQAQDPLKALIAQHRKADNGGSEGGIF